MDPIVDKLIEATILFIIVSYNIFDYEIFKFILFDVALGKFLWKAAEEFRDLNNGLKITGPLIRDCAKTQFGIPFLCSEYHGWC